jgi:hypothetical protein
VRERKKERKKERKNEWMNEWMKLIRKEPDWQECCWFLVRFCQQEALATS